MSLFENTLFSSHHPLLAHVTYWHRYVDAVLYLYEGPPPVAGEFLNHLNSFFPSIIFTLEVGGSNINFLDLTIRILEGYHTFSIYRKDSATDSTIDGASFCPWPHKLAAFHWYIHRLV